MGDSLSGDGGRPFHWLWGLYCVFFASRKPSSQTASQDAPHEACMPAGTTTCRNRRGTRPQKGTGRRRGLPPSSASPLHDIADVYSTSASSITDSSTARRIGITDSKYFISSGTCFENTSSSNEGISSTVFLYRLAAKSNSDLFAFI